LTCYIKCQITVLAVYAKLIKLVCSPGLKFKVEDDQKSGPRDNPLLIFCDRLPLEVIFITIHVQFWFCPISLCLNLRKILPVVAEIIEEMSK
jgi:hypothetical protein